MIAEHRVHLQCRKSPVLQIALEAIQYEYLNIRMRLADCPGIPAKCLVDKIMQREGQLVLDEDAVEAIIVDYVDLPSVTTIANAEADGAPDIREGKGNLLQLAANSPYHDPKSSGRWRRGGVSRRAIGP